MISVEEMERLEREADASEEELMERAGRGAARVLRERFSFDSVLVFAGGGNNAGDGFVMARYLQVPTGVLLTKELNGLPERQFQNVDWGVADCQADLVVDAMLGTGVEGELREPIGSAVRLFNALPGKKIALDVPTGVHPDTGEGELACDVDLTICFHDRKSGVAEPVEVVDIGLA